jgi:hypothetical protein
MLLQEESTMFCHPDCLMSSGWLNMWISLAVFVFKAAKWNKIKLYPWFVVPILKCKVVWWTIVCCLNFLKSFVCWYYSISLFNLCYHNYLIKRVYIRSFCTKARLIQTSVNRENCFAWRIIHTCTNTWYLITNKMCTNAFYI